MRKDDLNSITRFRSAQRVICMNGKWFFQTREQDHGPYPSEGVAQIELERYVSEMKFFSDVKKADEPSPATPDWRLTDFDEKEQRS